LSIELKRLDEAAFAGLMTVVGVGIAVSVLVADSRRSVASSGDHAASQIGSVAQRLLVGIGVT